MPLTEETESLKASLARRLNTARAETDRLFEVLDPRAMMDRPIPERHRIVFYLGHLEAFDWNLLGRSTFEMDPFNEAYDRLFAFGIDPVDGDLPDDRPSDWPSLAAVRGYVTEARERVDRILRETAFQARPRHDCRTVFNVAIEHRLMHAETLVYMLHWLSPEKKRRARGHASPAAGTVAHGWVDIPEGAVSLGQERHAGDFGWDNEFEKTVVEVPAFSIQAYNVTNRRYLDFVLAGGYEDRSLWDETSWSWLSSDAIRHPRFWVPAGDSWMYRDMFETVPLPMEWPVYVSHAEASAYALWAGSALPTEAQLHRATYGSPEGDERPYPWGWAPADRDRGNFGSDRWSPVPVGSFPAGDSAFGVADLVGNGWEWTSTVFQPFTGFEILPFYPGYSADFFDGRHYVMKGGSARTDASLLRRSFRNWFQPHYPYIYSTFRCVQA